MTQFYQLGGSERLAVELAERLNRRGVHADILSMYTSDLFGMGKTRESLLDLGIPSVHFLGMKVHPSVRSLISAISKLRCLLEENKYDIVETSSISPSVIAAWATRGTHVRCVTGVHQTFRRDRENTMRHKLWLLSLRCNRQISYYTISNYVTNYWIRYSHISSHRIQRIYNSISDDYFSACPERSSVRSELGVSEKVRLAIYVGRIASYKGIDTLLDALGPILKQENIVLLYIGRSDLHVKGTEDMIRKMKIDIVENGWGEWVKFLGYRNDTPRLMASSDVLVHPTRIEGFGLTLIESMAVGLPLVSSNVEGIPEVLEGTGLQMVAPDDPGRVRKMVLDVLNRSKKKTAVILEGGRLHAEKFRTDRRTDEFIKFFKAILS